VIYFPIILIVGQVLVNLVSFIFPRFYLSTGFYLNTFFGTNVLFAFFLLAFTFMFRFCAVSRWAAIAEAMFAINYLAVKEDNMYNIMFQIIIGTIAVLLTFWHYIKKFPLCRMSLLVGFFGSVIKKGNCNKGLEDWERNVKSIILKQTHRNHVK